MRFLPAHRTPVTAGGGIRGAQIYGATTPDAGFVVDKPVTPADLSATILHHLGVDSHQEYDDEFQQVRQVVSKGDGDSRLGVKWLSQADRTFARSSPVLAGRKMGCSNWRVTCTDFNAPSTKCSRRDLKNLHLPPVPTAWTGSATSSAG